MKKFKTVIIEDEDLARERLIFLLQEYQDCVEIISEANNGLTATKIIKELKPDLIFLDIQMPGLNGFQVLKEISLEHRPLVIFTTAYDEYALNAFETNAIDYLLKPIETEKLKRAISKLSLFSKPENYEQALERITSCIHQMNSSSEKIKKLKVKVGDEIIFLKLKDIYYFRAEGKYSMIITENESYLSNYSFSKLETILAFNFVKVHRSFIVNTDKVTRLKKWFGGGYKIEVNNKKKDCLPVSKNLKDSLLNKISITS